MKRFLNKVREVEIIPLVYQTENYEFKFRLDPSSTTNPTLSNLELVIGKHPRTGSGSKDYLFIHSNGRLFSLAHDDFSYDFISLERDRIESLIEDLDDSITDATITASLVERDGI
jgi:hypothetical protein